MIDRKNEGGFTLVELMVVVAIIAILASIGIPKMTAFIKTSETAEAVEQAGRIVKGIKGFLDSRNLADRTAFNTIIQPGASPAKGNLGGTATAANSITGLIPHLVLADDATFAYSISLSASATNTYVCVKAWKSAVANADTNAFILYSSVKAADTDGSWEGYVFRGKYIDNTLAGVAAGACLATGIAAAAP